MQRIVSCLLLAVILGTLAGCAYTEKAGVVGARSQASELVRQA